MRTVSRLTVTAAIVGGGILFAGPVLAQEADCDQYETLAECPLEGEVGAPAKGSAGGGATSGGGSAGGGGTATRGSSGGAASLPFTGGEVTLIALAGTAAVGGGVALTAAGRKRKAV